MGGNERKGGQQEEKTDLDINENGEYNWFLHYATL